MIKGMPMWEERRSTIKHDKLSNIYLNSIDAFISRIESGNKNIERLKRFIERDFRNWKEYNQEIESVLNDFEKEMSPMTLFNEQPLCRCDNETKEWLSHIIHELWMSRYSVGPHVDAGKDILKNTNTHFMRIIEIIDTVDINNPSQMKCLLPEFRDFRDACASLIDALSVFPRKVMVV